MDNEVDLALIQSEALYCLRREQLVSLCKRRGIKPRGKSSHLADMLRKSIEAKHSPSADSMNSSYYSMSPRTDGSMSPRSMQGLGWGREMPVRSPYMRPGTQIGQGTPSARSPAASSMHSGRFASVYAPSEASEPESHGSVYLPAHSPRMDRSRVASRESRGSAYSRAPSHASPDLPSTDRMPSHASPRMPPRLGAKEENETPKAQTSYDTDKPVLPTLPTWEGIDIPLDLLDQIETGSVKDHADEAVTPAPTNDTASVTPDNREEEEDMLDMLIQGVASEPSADIEVPVLRKRSGRVHPRLPVPPTPVTSYPRPAMVSPTMPPPASTLSPTMLGPMEEGKHLTHGETRRLPADEMAEQEAERKRKKGSMGGMVRRMRHFLDTSSAPPQPTEKILPYPVAPVMGEESLVHKPARKAASVIDDDMLRMAMMSSSDPSCLPDENTAPVPAWHTAAQRANSLRSTRRFDAARPRRALPTPAVAAVGGGDNGARSRALR